MHPDRVASLATRDRQHRRHWRRRPYIPVRSHGTDSDLTLGWSDQYRVLDTETQPPATVLNGPVFGPIGRPGSPDGRFLARVHALEAVFAGCCRNRVALGCSPLFRDFRFACPRWPLYTPEGRPAPETLVRHSIVPLQRPSAQPVVTCGRLEALCSRHFSDTAPHVGHFFANRTALPVPRVSLPAPAAPRSAATCRRTAAGLDVLPPAGASSTGHASRAGPRSSPAAAGDS